MKLIILDRDGVINFDSDQFIKHPDEWKPIPGSLDAIARLTREGWRVVVVGGADDSEAAATLCSHENLVNWTGELTVSQTAALLERADLFIGADSGPSHIAASAGLPSVILFSGNWTDLSLGYL